MSTELHYRGYVIYTDGHEFVAEPMDADDVVFELGSRKVDALVAAIDQMWDAIGQVESVGKMAPTPVWFQKWLAGGCVGRISVEDPPAKPKQMSGLPPLTSFLRAPAVVGLALALIGTSATIGARLDTDGDGLVSRQEIADYLTSRPWEPGSTPVLMRRVINYQGNHYRVSLAHSHDDPNVLDTTDVTLVKGGELTTAVN
ncbi:hypothetical protein [Methylobacterium sp. WL120]|uniref:hypothetical protein n=1 Tax=Methylobacterium sp. WL120 TaxID=2603887 RepID=UPI0011C7F83A|nr:hypothetical protein [Methylobacterium sp. WL120]TXM69637.1 hypothetical protein FV229_04650 [Methylobacterium sp. WL120]